MESEISSKSACTFNLTMGIIYMAIGIALAIVVFPLIFVTFFVNGVFAKIVYLLFVMGFAALATALIYFGTKRVGYSNRVKKYVSIIMYDDDLSYDRMAQVTMKTKEFVFKDIKKLIEKNLLINVYTDYEGLIVYTKDPSSTGSFPSQIKGRKCPHCGAPYARGSKRCAYCGATF